MGRVRLIAYVQSGVTRLFWLLILFPNGAQVAKIFTYYMVVRKWDFRMVIGSGGMPSSHSALCFALTTSVAFVHGVSDALFPVCLGFTLIVMYDAAGVRRHAGKQAEVRFEFGDGRNILFLCCS
jgi:acid phosphatase family membrane protein YuiD